MFITMFCLEGWNKLYVKIRPVLDDVKRRRLIQERYDLIVRRRRALDKMYDTYVSSLRRSEIPSMPVRLPILRFGKLQDLLLDASKDEVNDRICEELMTELADDLKRWKGERSREMAGRVVREYPGVLEMPALGPQSQTPANSGSLSNVVRQWYVISASNSTTLV